MIGLSGSYAFNGSNLTLQPETGQWQERDSFGIDGAGHPIYSRVRSFELVWGLVSMSELNQITTFYNQVQNTGTCSVDLPKWGDSQYLFTTYSGATLQEPTVGTYFETYVQDVRLVILNILGT
jgi:hypothetical protein